jgi:hypothetical protein
MIRRILTVFFLAILWLLNLGAVFPMNAGFFPVVLTFSAAEFSRRDAKLPRHFSDSAEDFLAAAPSPNVASSVEDLINAKWRAYRAVAVSS